MKNHLGGFECKLCLTLHPNEGSYLSHTQGKKHQSNLGKRAAFETKNAAPKLITLQKEARVKMIRIGRPGYKVTKSRDISTRQRCLKFELEYPDASEGMQPRHRFMSAYEQKVTNYYLYIYFRFTFIVMLISLCTFTDLSISLYIIYTIAYISFHASSLFFSLISFRASHFIFSRSKHRIKTTNTSCLHVSHTRLWRSNFRVNKSIKARGNLLQIGTLWQKKSY